MEQGSGERPAGGNRDELGQHQKAFQREARIVPGSEASSQGTGIAGGAEICQVGGRLCECPGEERQRVCAPNQPGSLN